MPKVRLTIKSNPNINKYDLAANLAIAGVNEKSSIKLSKKEQENIFGFYLIGKQSIKISNYNPNIIEITRKTWAGNQSEILFIEFTYEELANRANQKRKIEVN